MFYSPLEQFAIIVYEFILFKVTNIFIFRSFIMLALIIFLYSNLVENNNLLIPNRVNITINYLINFVISLCIEQIGSKKTKVFAPFYLTIFLSILLSNLTSLIPFTITIKAHLSINLGLSFSIFIGTTILGFIWYQERFLDGFLPMGVPLVLQPALVLIEIISFIAKACSLGVRLAANMLAGHTLLFLVSTFLFFSQTNSHLILNLYN